MGERSHARVHWRAVARQYQKHVQRQSVWPHVCRSERVRMKKNNTFLSKVARKSVPGVESFRFSGVCYHVASRIAGLDRMRARVNNWAVAGFRGR